MCASGSIAEPFTGSIAGATGGAAQAQADAAVAGIMGSGGGLGAMSPLSQVRFGSVVFGKAMRTSYESLAMSWNVAETHACCLQLVNGNFTEGLAATDNDVAGATRPSRLFALADLASIDAICWCPSALQCHGHGTC
eukprot:COSAG04_NODE_636_length_11710_cov_63.646973_3_plen_137_part_00